MKNTLRHLSLLLIVSLVFTFQLKAQKYFEGEMELEFSSFDKKKNSDKIMAYLSPARIKLMSADRKVDVSMIGANDVSNLLIRLDNEDFVIQSDETSNSAIKITKLEIENLVNFTQNMANRNSEDASLNNEVSKFNVIKTSEKRKIAGYQAYLLKISNREEPNEEFHVWITDKLNVHLGMLSGGWEFLDSFTKGSTQWLEQGKFPLLVQNYNNGKVTSELRVTTIKKKKIDADFLSVPSGVQLLSFQDMLMKQWGGKN